MNINLSKITAKYIGKSFNDYGCGDFVYHFLKDMGLNPPEGCGTISIHNYKEKVNKNIKNAQIEMIKCFRNLGKKINPKYPKIGNLLIIKQPSRVLFPAVYVGNGCAIASFIKSGIQVFKIDKYNRAIMAREL